MELLAKNGCEFEWDKNQANHIKHGFTFEEGVKIFDFGYPVATNEASRIDYGEKRFLDFGCIASQIVLIVVYTVRQSKKRIISVRRANRQERKKYNEFIEKTHQAN